jgi:hypothetical protein
MSRPIHASVVKKVFVYYCFAFFGFFSLSF